MSGLDLNLQMIFGLAILTCYHMEEGKVPSSMAGSQDALLPILIGMLVNQATVVTMKIMYKFKLVVENGMTTFLNCKNPAAVSTPQL